MKKHIRTFYLWSQREFKNTDYSLFTNINLFKIQDICSQKWYKTCIDQQIFANLMKSFLDNSSFSRNCSLVDMMIGEKPIFLYQLFPHHRAISIFSLKKVQKSFDFKTLFHINLPLLRRKLSILRSLLSSRWTLTSHTPEDKFKQLNMYF